MINEEIRNYEVSLWTLQDEFITVLKWSNIETQGLIGDGSYSVLKTLQKGTIQDPKFTIADDGTQNFNFSIPMYLYQEGQLVENPIWYNTQNSNLMEGLRKIKVIFNKGNANKKIFEFLITKITEDHEADHLFCSVECEGLAFNELGKTGYKYTLSTDDFELDYKEWQETGSWKKYNGTSSNDKPLATVSYWCDKIGLLPSPQNDSDIDPRAWYYKIEMNWSSYSDGSGRDAVEIYEEPFVSSWNYSQNSDSLVPVTTEGARVKQRTIDVKESNIYNITQSIAEAFGIFCRYDYGHDANGHIISRTVVFFNNFIHDADIMSFTYPHSSKKISRERDATGVTTKLYVPAVDDSTTLLGEASIRYCDANKSEEDYILNFDYLKDTNSITDEQYAAIEEYEKDIHNINEELYPIENKIMVYENQIIDLRAKKTFYENAIDADQEQINNNNDFIVAINSADGIEDAYVTRDRTNPEQGIIVQDKQDNYCILLNSKTKGIKADSVEIYRKYSTTTHTCDTSTQVTDFSFTYDEYGNPNAIYGVAPDTSQGAVTPNIVWMVYNYDPKLYYEAIKKTWEERYKTDNTNLGLVSSELNTIETELEVAKTRQEELLQQKKDTITEFNYLMGPAIREGYWIPENYVDYGEKHNLDVTLSSTYDNSFITASTGKNCSIGWDTTPFDGEQNIYYEESPNQNRIYYPCVNLSSIIGQSSFYDNLDKISFIFNNNYYDSDANLNDIKNIRSFAIGSEAILGFVKQKNSTTVYPALILVGAKNMTTDNTITTGGTLGFMLDPDRGHPKLGTLTTTISGNNVSTSVTSIKTLSASDFKFGEADIEDCEVVFPRIKFSSLMLKTSSDELFIKQGNTLLENYKDYTIHNRPIQSENYSPVYLITIKPEAIISKGTLNNIVFNVSYTLSNASDAIYLDALEISKENAYPKVSYTIDPNILNKDIIATLYNKLNWLVMINDVQLKLKDTFGYISKLELDLDFPQNDVIEVKNYSNKFEDLFSTIVAQTEAMRRAESGLGAAMGGEVALTTAALEKTLSQQEMVFQAYLDSHFDSSQVVKDRLTELFTEAGEILSDSNKTLEKMRSLTLENASILGGFAQNIAEELTVKTYYSSTKPENFKSGDIWINGDYHYVATSDSSVSGSGATAGFVRTYDGTLASITGAALNINADDGIIDITAANEINIESGNSVKIAANDKVDIVGNREVNIGGTTINIASESANGTVGGINIVAAKYDTVNIANSRVAKVLIHPDEIYMAGSQITMLTGTGSDAVSAIKIDGRTVSNGGAEYGIWLGSNKGIRLFSGEPVTTNNLTTYGANVEINPTHIFFGMGNTSNGNATAAELTEKHIIFAAGNTIGSLDGDNEDITIDNNVAGVKITKDKIGLAIGSGTDRSAIIMSSAGLVLGTAGNNNGTATSPINNGSYVKISGAGVEIGSLGNLYVNMNNFKLQTDTTNGTRFAVGKDLQYITSNGQANGEIANSAPTLGSDQAPWVGMIFTNNNLYIQGTVYASAGSFTGAVHASSFELTGTAISDFNTAVGASSTVSGINTNINNTTKSTVLIYYLSSSTTAPSAPSTEVTTASTTSLNTWALSYPEYPVDNSTAYYYYSCIQSKTEGGTVTWSTPTRDYGVTSAARAASLAKITNDTFTTNGLLANHSWGGETWPVALTSTGNMLIGANTGLYFVKPSASSATNGAALVIDDSGIAMAGSTISLNADSTISITSGATIDINASNFTIKSSPSNGENYFYVGDSGNSPSSYIKYTKGANGNTFEVKGAITATSFTLGSDGHALGISDVSGLQTALDNASSSGWSINGLSNGSRELSASDSTAISTVELTSTYALSLGANYGIFIPRTSSSKLDDTYVSITSNHINFDYSSTNYIHMDNNGIDMKGSRIKINDREIWGRDDIIVMNPNANNVDPWRDTVAHIEEYMNGQTVTINGTDYNRGSASQGDWVLIRPFYDASVTYYYNGSETISTAFTNSKYTLNQNTSNGQISFGSGSYFYKYTVSFKAYGITNSDTSDSIHFNISLSTNSDMTNAVSITTDDNAIYTAQSSLAVSFTGEVTSSGSGKINLCPEDTNKIYMQISESSGSSFYIINFSLLCETDATTSRVPCTIYYYPKVTS